MKNWLWLRWLMRKIGYMPIYVTHFEVIVPSPTMTVEEIEKLPCPACPFCGNDDIGLEWVGPKGPLGWMCQIYCKKCGMRLRPRETDRKACEAWAGRWPTSRTIQLETTIGEVLSVLDAGGPEDRAVDVRRMLRKGLEECVT